MKAAKIHLELLLGKLVRDAEGARAGRILSVRAERQGDQCVIRSYHLGPAALMSRLGISTQRLVGWPARHEPLRVPWDQLDLSDPEQPRLRCTLAELKKRER